MKLKYEFIMTEIDDQITAVPVGEGVSDFCGIIRINESGRAIMELLAEETTEEKIVEELSRVYTAATKEELGMAVHLFIEELHKAGVLSE